MTDVPEPGAVAEEVPLETDALEALGNAVGWPDAVAEDAAREALDDPDGALGRLGDLAVWWASVRGEARPAPPSRVLLVGGSAQVTARRPLRTLAFDPAADARSPERDLTAGLEAADAAAADGVDLVVLCLDAPASARTITAELLGLDAVDATGWPTDQGLSDPEWMDEVAALRDRLFAVRGAGARPADLAAALEPPVTATVAFLLRALARRVPVLLDGVGAGAAALLARRAGYAATGWWQAAHRPPGRLSERVFTALNLTPLTDLGVRREDGTGGLAGLAVLETAAALLPGAGPPGADPPGADPPGAGPPGADPPGAGA